jgi:hypothetical protein
MVTPALGGPLEDRAVPGVGGLGLLVELVQAAPVPQAAVDLELGPVDIQRDGVGGVGLQLDGVAAGVGGRVDHLQRPVEAAVVVSRQLADHIGRIVGADPRPAISMKGAVMGGGSWGFGPH